MTLSSKLLIFSTLFFPFLSASAQDLSFQLSKVAFPTTELVDQQNKDADHRVFKKYVVTSSVIIGSLVAMYLLYQIRDAAAVNQAAQSKMCYVPKDVDPAKIPVALKPIDAHQNWSSWFLQSSKNFSLGVGKLFADSGLLLVSGLVMQGAWNYASNKLSQVYTEESVLWYAYEKTQIPNLFNDLKLYATDYDLFASLLSTELLNQDAKAQMKAFVTDLVGAAHNHLSNDMFRDLSYFEYLLQDMKKKYIQKGKEIEKLEEFVVPAAAKRHRALAQEHATALFAQDLHRRADIATMCEVFVEEMQKLLSFVAMRGGLRQKARIVDMIDASNKFLERMEKLLNSTPEQLQVLSKQDCGMFTSVYEYEKLFSEQINFLHRYCKLTN